MNETNLPAIRESHSSLSVFQDISSFENAQRMAQALASSALVPTEYRGNVANCLVAVELAQRCMASPIMVMQSLHIIEGRPSWASSFIIAAINSSRRFAPLRFKMVDLGVKSVEYEAWEGPKGARQKRTGKLQIHDMSCVAWTSDRSGEILEGPKVTVEIAVREGWYTRAGSKWQTLPELMIQYRAASFFGRLYAPEILLGMRSDDEEREIIDVTPNTVTDPAPADKAAEINAKVRKARKPAVEVAPMPEQIHVDPNVRTATGVAEVVLKTAAEGASDGLIEAAQKAPGMAIAVGGTDDEGGHF